MLKPLDPCLQVRPAYEKISRRSLREPGPVRKTPLARAWFKLTHATWVPRARISAWSPAEELIWQDPIPAVINKLIDAKDIDSLKGKILASGCPYLKLVATAWASASTFRGSDKRGVRMGRVFASQPQKDWEVSEPAN